MEKQVGKSDVFTTSSLKSTNDLTTILEKYEEDLDNANNEIDELEFKV